MSIYIITVVISGCCFLLLHTYLNLFPGHKLWQLPLTQMKLKPGVGRLSPHRHDRHRLLIQVRHVQRHARYAVGKSRPEIDKIRQNFHTAHDGFVVNGHMEDFIERSVD